MFLFQRHSGGTEPGLGRASGTAWSFTDLVLGEAKEKKIKAKACFDFWLFLVFHHSHTEASCPASAAFTAPPGPSPTWWWVRRLVRHLLMFCIVIKDTLRRRAWPRLRLRHRLVLK